MDNQHFLTSPWIQNNLEVCVSRPSWKTHSISAQNNSIQEQVDILNGELVWKSVFTLASFFFSFCQILVSSYNKKKHIRRNFIWETCIQDDCPIGLITATGIRSAVQLGPRYPPFWQAERHVRPTLGEPLLALLGSDPRGKKRHQPGHWLSYWNQKVAASLL